ncbi:MAG TPA: translation initiation factor IF-2 N-terminal domain-containing protein, partial [Phycisphaerales bacterium]|nr:translation initiation factor IF-2 N-terminal domain-containing protein [Phycisphaerales bacterium]
MAKKVTTIRVHQIAKELGVASKDVVAKCGEEGVPNITNHMSAISFGLAATIREWFDDSATGSTAVQTAAPVDIKQARAKAKKKVRKTTTKKASAKAAVKEPPADIATPAPEPPPSATRGTGLIEPPSRVPPPEVPSNQPEEKPATKAIPNEPERPEKVEQLGRKLEEPKKSQLSGPKVIRVEQPENIRPPRPKGPPRSSPDKPSGGPNLGGPPPPDATDRGRPSRRNRRRTGTADRGTDARDTKQQQGASVGQRNWREQDLREREQRLSRSGGYFRSVRRDSAKRASGPT